MRRRDLAELLLLGALWGASFLFMRLGATQFGPVALVFVRVTGAALLLMPLLAWQGHTAALRAHWRGITVLGLVNSTLPFLLYMVAALVLSAGLMAVFNTTAPIWTALIAALWLGERLGPARALGLAIGVAGVVFLVAAKADLAPAAAGTGGDLHAVVSSAVTLAIGRGVAITITPALGIAACLGATLLYGFAANHARQRLAGVPPLALAAGSQLSASACMLLPAWWAWPATAPTAGGWGAAATLAVVCTGLGYLLYFKLIAQVGAARAISVTFLIPGFAMLWGWVFLGEKPKAAMLLGCAVILLGTALSTGALRLGRSVPALP